MTKKPRTFTHEIRVPYADVDQMGFVYYANYLVYFEMARSSLLREVGMPYSELEKRGVMMPIIEAHCEYASAGHFDDLLTVYTTCTGVKGTRLRLEYEIKRDTEQIVTGHTVHICMSPEGKVMRPDPSLKCIWAPS